MRIVPGLVRVDHVRMRHRRLELAAWQGYGLCGLIALGAYYAFPGGSHAQFVVGDGIAASSVVVILTAVATRSPAEPRGWLLQAAGVAAFTVGDVIWNAYGWSGGASPFPSIADVFYLLQYPLLAWGIVYLFRWRRAHPAGDVLDAALLTAGATLLLWFLVIVPSVSGSGLDVLGRVITVAYPTMDLLLLAVIAFAAFSVSKWTPSLRLLALGIVCMLVADVAYARTSITGSYTDGSWIDSGWELFYIAIGVAALHPSAGEQLPTAAAPTHAIRWRRFALVAVMALIAPAAAIYMLVVHDRVPVVLSAFTLIITVLAIARVAVLLQRQHEAEDGLRAVEAERRRLLEEMLRAADEARTAVARDLHDGPIQALTTLTLELDLLASRADHTAATRMAGLRTRLTDEIRSLRGLTTELQPSVLAEEGLGAALATCAASVLDGSGIEYAVHSAINGAPVPRDIAAMAYRLAHEALLNARMHSSAHTVEVWLKPSGDSLRLVIDDDGVGFSEQERRHAASEGHAGLPGMQEMAGSVGGSWTLWTEPGLGTRVEIALPWRHAAAAA